MATTGYSDPAQFLSINANGMAMRQPNTLAISASLHDRRATDDP